jgi:hypothetical protein
MVGRDAERRKAFATELIRLAPDVIACSAALALAELRRLTSTIGPDRADQNALHRSRPVFTPRKSCRQAVVAALPQLPMTRPPSTLMAWPVI